MIILSKARLIAEDLVKLLQPFCIRIDIAGSVRRGGKREVKDIEIVCAPQLIWVSTDLFGTDGKYVPIAAFADALQSVATRILKGKVTGRMLQLALPGEIKVDLFMPQPHDYYRQLAIRTGPAEYSHKVLAAAWVKKGWVGTEQGLRRRIECIETGGKWVCIHPHPELPPVWFSEPHLFAWLGLEYLHPSVRIINGAAPQLRGTSQEHPLPAPA
jgi:DNA polymerase/3'-5' exonuclease PolX